MNFDQVKIYLNLLTQCPFCRLPLIRKDVSLCYYDLILGHPSEETDCYARDTFSTISDDEIKIFLHLSKSSLIFHTLRFNSKNELQVGIPLSSRIYHLNPSIIEDILKDPNYLEKQLNLLKFYE